MDTSERSSDGHDADDDCPASSGEVGSDAAAANCAGGDCGLKMLFNWCVDCYFPRRYVVVLFLFVGMCVTHAQRVNVGVAVVSIVDARHRILPIELATSNTSVVAVVRDSVRPSTLIRC